MEESVSHTRWVCQGEERAGHGNQFCLKCEVKHKDSSGTET